MERAYTDDPLYLDDYITATNVHDLPPAHASVNSEDDDLIKHLRFQNLVQFLTLTYLTVNRKLKIKVVMVI